jgi:hypothetical protein
MFGIYSDATKESIVYEVKKARIRVFTQSGAKLDRNHPSPYEMLSTVGEEQTC